MNVLVSGARGSIGRALCGRLAGGGHRVVALVRPGGQNRPGGTVEGVTGTVDWDPDRGTIDVAALQATGPYDAVVHLAGAPMADRRWTAARRRELRDSRVRGAALLAGALDALEPRPQAFVSASGVGYYGDRRDDVLTEDDEPGTGFLADLCVAWERAALLAAHGGTRVVTARLGVVLATGGGVLGRLVPLFRLGLGGRVGAGRQYVSWVSMDDALGALEAALSQPRLAGPINVCAPSPVRNAELARALGRALHRPALLVVPSPAAELFLGRSLVRELLLASQRALPARLQDAGYRFEHPDIDTALGSLLGGAVRKG